MQIIPQTEPIVGSTPEKTSNEFSRKDYAAAGALPQPAEDTASRLGDWKLPETAQAEQSYAGIEEPVLAVLPDLTAELYHSPAQIEEVWEPQPAVEEIHPEAMVEPEIRDTEATAEPGKEELVAPPEPQPSISSSSELETSTVKEEENTWAESAASVSDELELAFTSEAPLAKVEEVESWSGPQTPDSNGPSAAAGHGALIIPVEMDPAWAEPPAAASNELSSTSFSEAALAQAEEHKSWMEPEGVARIESSSTPVREGPVGQPDGGESWTAISSISNELSSTPALEPPVARLEENLPGEAFLGVIHAQVDSASAQEPPGVGMEEEAPREMPQSITGSEVVEEPDPGRELQSPSPFKPQVLAGASKELATFSTPASDASSSATQEALLCKPEV
ncbi:MAG: hypothetical protein ACREP9_06425, partial [Candidatus Dormibacteraceae bacterium]